MYEAFLKEYDLNEETMEKIIKECSKHCRSLRNFLMFSSWHSIPSYRLRTILDIYNKSSVNIKTGELIDISKDKSSKQLKNLSIRDIAKTIRIGSKAVFSDGKHIPYIFNITAFDDEGKRLKNHNLSKRIFRAGPIFSENTPPLRGVSLVGGGINRLIKYIIYN